NIHRSYAGTEIYFVANTSHRPGIATCAFKVTGLQPELWDPVTVEMRDLPQYEEKDGKTIVPLKFADAQSFFIVFRKQANAKGATTQHNFPLLKEIAALNKPWQVQFDSTWGGPSKPVTFSRLEDWTKRPEK